jgi:type III pantothenate kinase
LYAALARETARLQRIDPKPGVRALGQDTESAVQSGVVVGFEGAARELVLRVAAEAAIADAPVLLTGGAREFLVASSTFSRGLRVLEDPELVALGILAAHAAKSSACARES